MGDWNSAYGEVVWWMSTLGLKGMICKCHGNHHHLLVLNPDQLHLTSFSHQTPSIVEEGVTWSCIIWKETIVVCGLIFQ
jgi:hypothetical protein